MIKNSDEARTALQTAANTLNGLAHDPDRKTAQFAQAVLSLQDVTAYILTQLERKG